MPKTLTTVLRTGGEYTAEHVFALARNLAKIHPDAFLVCLTDQPNIDHAMPNLGFRRVGPNSRWPGWWFKMNLFDPVLRGDALYCDLDTVLVGSLDPLWDISGDGSVVLRDFYRPDGLGSGLMRITPALRQDVWADWWAQGPDTVIAHWQAQGLGDQAFLETTAAMAAARWQDVLPGAVLSYKADIRDKGRSPASFRASVICFHGHPRPWAVSDQWVLDARA